MRSAIVDQADPGVLKKAAQETSAQLQQLQGQLAVLREENFFQSDQQAVADPKAPACNDAAVQKSCAALTAAFAEAFGIEFRPRGNQAPVKQATGWTRRKFPRCFAVYGARRPATQQQGSQYPVLYSVPEPGTVLLVLHHK
jgi:hypothetical protein